MYRWLGWEVGHCSARFFASTGMWFSVAIVARFLDLVGDFVVYVGVGTNTSAQST